MKVGKPKSKRVPVRLRHKIQKNSAEKQRKERKAAKKNPQWRSRLKKDPGIPNLFPYKDRVLAEIEESKRKKEEDKERRKEIAKAQREGRAVVETAAEDEDEELEDAESDGDEDDVMDEEDDDSANPLAALVASAQARAQKYSKDDEDYDEEDEDEEEDGEEIASAKQLKGIAHNKKRITTNKTTEVTKKALPKHVLEEPIKPVARLITRLQQTRDGIPQLLAYYQLAPLVTAGSDATTRFLVDVARKRGRLGRGGVPNLNGAALTVLGDLNEGRLVLPALQEQRALERKGEVQIVSQMAEPFRIEGLFGDHAPSAAAAAAGAEMEVEA
jgi:nuclear GTP-binding protein